MKPPAGTQFRNESKPTTSLLVATWRRYLCCADEGDLGFWPILLIATTIFCPWTALYFVLRTEPSQPPKGERVDLIMKVEKDGKFGRTYGFKQRKEDIDDKRPRLVYEGSTPLPADRYEVKPVNPEAKWRIVKFVSSDGSDPRYNGRSYYAVIP